MQYILIHICSLGTPGGPVVERRTLEREVGVRSSLRSLCCVLELDQLAKQVPLHFARCTP